MQELNTQFSEQMLSAYLFFFNYQIVLQITICAGKEFQTFTILLKKKCFALFDVRSVVT